MFLELWAPKKIKLKFSKKKSIQNFYWLGLSRVMSTQKNKTEKSRISFQYSSYVSKIILSYLHISFSCCHNSILLYCHIVILLYCYIVILLYCYIVILSYCYIVILSYCHIVILSYCHIVILSCFHMVIFPFFQKISHGVQFHYFFIQNFYWLGIFQFHYYVWNLNRKFI